MGDSLYIAAYNDGLLSFDTHSNKFSSILHLPGGQPTFLMRDNAGKIWMSDDSWGLYVCDISERRFEHFAHDPDNPMTLSHPSVWNTYQDTQGRVWIGSRVLNLWEQSTRSFKHFPNSTFSGATYADPIGSDRRGRLWVCYPGGGLSILDPAGDHFINFDYSDGVIGAINMSSLQDGKVMLVGYGGMNIVDPDSLYKSLPSPPLVITKVSINDTTSLPLQRISAGSALALPYDQNVVEFEFAAIDPGATHLIDYQYRFEGLENAWVHPNARRFVRYPGLSPGDYVFKVKAVNRFGRWRDQEIALAVSIAPPWWRTWWAYAVYAVLLISTLFAGYRLRLRQLYLGQQVEMEHFQAERLAEVDKLKSRFFANISHEFRTPLTLILGPIRQAIERPDDPTHLQKLHLVEDNTKKLHGLVNQLLDFSRIESGTMKLQVSRSDVVQFLRRTVMSFESWAERKKINLEFRSETESADGFFDSDKLEKIVNNLMSNALKFTSEAGTVSVTVSEFRILSSELRAQNSIPRSGIAIAVSDTGPGISAEHLPHIFDRFYRVDDTHTTEGTGIGLALTKELVDLHHGTIAVESTQGKGSAFTVTLPIEESAYKAEEIVELPPQIEKREHPNLSVPSEESRAVPGTSPAEGKPIVLIVEDNADLRAYIREYLEADYAVQEAGNGKEGYDQATEIVPDIVVSDVMMPEMDGMELCRTLKQDVRTSHVPVILLTARAGTDSKMEGLGIGADDYVTKPFDTRELGARVRNLIEQRRQLRKKFSAGVVLKPGEVAVTSLDDALLKRVMETVEKRMGDEDFGVVELAREVSLSPRHLYRKLLSLTNLPPNDFIQYMRLQRAHSLLEKNAGPVAEIAFEVGFGSPAYFSSSFHKRFGYPPSEIRRKDS
jgi:signal transduction histidine kinase/DNA-binding response OmpR family regulator